MIDLVTTDDEPRDGKDAEGEWIGRVWKVGGKADLIGRIGQGVEIWRG